MKRTHRAIWDNKLLSALFARPMDAGALARRVWSGNVPVENISILCSLRVSREAFRGLELRRRSDLKKNLRRRLARIKAVKSARGVTGNIFPRRFAKNRKVFDSGLMLSLVPPKSSWHMSYGSEKENGSGVGAGAAGVPKLQPVGFS
jgi:hypothetical protein